MYFRCALKHSDDKKSQIEKLSVHVCNEWHAGSESHQVQFMICNKKYSLKDRTCAFNDTCLPEHKDHYGNKSPATTARNRDIKNACCKTNNFGWYEMRDGKAFWANEWKAIDGNIDRDDDGGEQLGPCEGHEIKGQEIFLYCK